MIQIYTDKSGFNIEVKDAISPYYPERPTIIKYRLYTISIYHWDSVLVNEVLQSIGAHFTVEDKQDDNQTTN